MLLKRFISLKAWKGILPLSRTTFVYRSHAVFTPQQLIIIDIIILSTGRCDFITTCCGWKNNLNSFWIRSRRCLFHTPPPTNHSCSTCNPSNPDQQQKMQIEPYLVMVYSHLSFKLHFKFYFIYPFVKKRFHSTIIFTCFFHV